MARGGSTPAAAVINFADTMTENLPSLSLVGAVLDGKYQIAHMIGHGGMGAVYEARHLGTERPVAVKVLLSALVRSNEAVERFRREARAAGRLRHPNIVDVTDFGVARVAEEDVAYLVMEYLEGSTLRRLIEERGALPLETVVGIIEQIAIAVQAAHDAGIIHRDLKPDNVWLIDDARGGFTVRVLDFGIARMSGESRIARAPLAVTIDADAETVGLSRERPGHSDETAVWTTPAPESASTDRLTMAGSTLGTPLYMSPEQCAGHDAGERSDLYSLGIITYEMLTGRRPFAGRFHELVEQHLRVAPPPLEGVSPRVAAVVMRALSKEPASRHASARALAGSLRAASEGPGMILRRSIALYAERFPEFFAVSASVSRPPVVMVLTLLALAAVTGATAGLRHGALVLMVTAGSGSVLWFFITSMTNATFAAAIERLRLRPLEALDPSQLAADLRRRIGLEETAGYFKTLRHLVSYYVRCEVTSRPGTGDLAFLIAFLEGVPFGEIAPRCDVLATGSRRPYAVVRGAIFVALFLLPFLEAGMIFMLLEPFVRFSGALAFMMAFALVPINAMFINPIFSSALTLLYFRARQANGEDVPLSAVLPGRV